jgi:hypothetical protein
LRTLSDDASEVDDDTLGIANYEENLLTFMVAAEGHRPESPIPQPQPVCEPVPRITREQACLLIAVFLARRKQVDFR